jgi:hypothetical protein
MADAPTLLDIFGDLHTNTCDATWDHSQRRTTVKQINCFICFERRVGTKPTESQITQRIVRQAARIVCPNRCAFRDPEYRTISDVESWWHPWGWNQWERCKAAELWDLLRAQT